MRRLVGTLLLLMPLISCGRLTATESHLIPEGYRGDVFIVPNISNGQSPERDGRTIIFRIPANGILVTQDAPSEGWHVARFYYVGPGGNRRLLDEEPSSVHDTSENRADMRPFVWFQRSGTMNGTDLPCTISYAQYYVGTRFHLLTRDQNVDELRFRQYVREHHVCP